MIAKGDHVVWTNGARGLTGVVTGSLVLDAEPGWEDLLEISTVHGLMHEFPRNLRPLEKMSGVMMGGDWG